MVNREQPMKTKPKSFTEPPPTLGSRHFARRFERWWKRKYALVRTREIALAFSELADPNPLEGLAREYHLRPQTLTPAERQLLEASLDKLLPRLTRLLPVPVLVSPSTSPLTYLTYVTHPEVRA
jgi:hypothetical protein